MLNIGSVAKALRYEFFHITHTSDMAIDEPVTTFSVLRIVFDSVSFSADEIVSTINFDRHSG